MRKSNSDRPSPTNPTPAARIKACCYMRVGTAEQVGKTDNDISIAVQRERLLSLAEQAGYEITYWYVDQRCSGSKPLKRHEWHKLLSDAATAEWEVVLCLNRERFNRLNHIEQGMVLQSLQKTGKRLHTAVEGPLDWDASAGEIIDTMIDAENKGGTSPMPKPIKVCAYLRVGSSDKHDQDSSLQAQTEAILKLAEREGYEIIEQYADVGCSGSKDNKHPGWSKLLADAPTAEWEVVLCYDRARFSRFDSIEEGFAKQILREANKRLHTAAEGLVDWNTASGRIMDTIRCQEAHEYAAKLGRATLEGKLIIFRKGGCVTGRCPYGYAFRVTDPHGNSHQFNRKEKLRVPKGWSKIFIPGDPKEVEVVQRLFTEYATKAVSFHSLASELNDKGVPAPQGEKWLGSTIVQLLANDAYVGDTRFGRYSTGKFFRLDGDKVVKAERGTPNEQRKGLVRQNTHEGIIDRATWDLVQAKLNSRSKKE